MRFQKGQLFEAAGKYYVRFYRDGKQVSKLLCVKDDKHYVTKSKARKTVSGPLQNLQIQFMQTINNSQTLGSGDMLISDFWEHVFLPFIEKGIKSGDKKPSTLRSYQGIWKSYLADHFDGRKFSEYNVVTGSKFLTALTERGLSANTVSSCRGLASAVFQHYMRTEEKQTLEFNIWAVAKSLRKMKKQTPPQQYTLKESVAAILALKGFPEYQLIMGLACFQGLRPGEISALRWEDFGVRIDDQVIPGCERSSLHIRRALWKGNVGTPKKDSAGVISVIEPVQNLLNAWWKECGEPKTGWVFTKSQGKRLGEAKDVITLKRTIQSLLEAKNIPFKGLYAGRRGTGTLVTELYGNALAAKDILRHKDLQTTTAHYVKTIPQAGIDGMRLVNKKVSLLLEGGQ